MKNQKPETVIKDEFKRLKNELLFGNIPTDRENRTTVSDVPSFPKIFHMKDLTFEQAFAKCDTTIRVFYSLRTSSLGVPRGYGGGDG